MDFMAIGLRLLDFSLAPHGALSPADAAVNSVDDSGPGVDDDSSHVLATSHGAGCVWYSHMCWQSCLST